MGYSIRPASANDSAALSRICLLTANYGTSAEHLHRYGELPGLYYAVPYVNLPTGFGFVLVSKEEGGDDDGDDAGAEEIIGYIVGTVDTLVYRESAEKDWYPPIREKYPLNDPSDTERKPSDVSYIKKFHNPDRYPQEMLDFSPTHIHINILPKAQRQGWGKKLIGRAVAFLKEKDPQMKGFWNGVDPRNEDGKRFYKKIGGDYTVVKGGAEYFMFNFSKWQD